jgi:hypothetical protein
MPLSNMGTFQDGGIAVNNPVCLAVQEAVSLQPDMTEPSIVVSLGTGSTSESDVESSSILSGKFLPRLWRGLWRQTSSKTTWGHFLGHQRPDSKLKFFRFDVDFVEDGPLLDDVSEVNNVQHVARKTVSGSPDLRTLCRQLRAEFFLFELDKESPPIFNRGAYHCSGRIICRLRAHTPGYQAFIQQLRSRAALLRLGSQNFKITHEELEKDLCYNVKFIIQNIDSEIAITFSERPKEEFNISGSPYTLDWLIRRQKLDASFGTSDHQESKNSLIRI